MVFGLARARDDVWTACFPTTRSHLFTKDLLIGNVPLTVNDGGACVAGSEGRKKKNWDMVSLCRADRREDIKNMQCWELGVGKEMQQRTRRECDGVLRMTLKDGG